MLTPFLAKSGLEEGLQRHLRHLILSHHGTAEFGAVRLPQTAEALALHFADNMDAKMAQCRDLFAQISEGSWTPYQATLNRALYKGPRTPETPPAKSRPRSRHAPREELLSLL